MYHDNIESPCFEISWQTGYILELHIQKINNLDILEIQDIAAL